LISYRFYNFFGQVGLGRPPPLGVPPLASRWYRTRVVIVSNTKLTTLTPASIVQTQLILKEFSHLVATNAAEIRNLVTNKLVLETENADPRIRMRALELLGKISDVGLFAERKEVTITHQNTTELQEKLRTKLEKLKNLKKNVEGVYEVVDTEDIEDAEIVEADE
jgi:hypothetical protein